MLGWQARDQLADPAELLERGLQLAWERRIFEYLAGVGVGDRLFAVLSRPRTLDNG